MKLQTIMTTDVEIVNADDSLQIAAQKMRDRDVGFLPVLDNGRLAGVITDRDIAIRAIAAGLDPVRTKVRNLATTDVIWGYHDQDDDKAARLMEDYQIRRLVILHPESQAIVGVISLGDLARNTKVQDKAAEVLEKVSEPANEG
jgi:CBS domain-containing protein